VNQEQIRGQLVNYAHKLGFREWVANHDGNLSVRLSDGQFLATPTAVHKADVDHTMLIVIDEAGQVATGTRKVFSEWELHRAVYAARPDVTAVIHAHPPYATAAAVAGVSFDLPIMAEPVVSLGASIPLVPFFAPKDAAGLATLGRIAESADALLLENHGVLAYGPSLELAYLRLDLVEHQARIRALAQHFGGARAIPTDVVNTLLQARQKAGLAAPTEAQSADLRAMIARIVSEELGSA